LQEEVEEEELETQIHFSFFLGRESFFPLTLVFVVVVVAVVLGDAAVVDELVVVEGDAVDDGAAFVDVVVVLPLAVDADDTKGS
jgi:hypothetical protein